MNQMGPYWETRMILEEATCLIWVDQEWGQLHVLENADHNVKYYIYIYIYCKVFEYASSRLMDIVQKLYF